MNLKVTFSESKQSFRPGFGGSNQSFKAVVGEVIDLSEGEKQAAYHSGYTDGQIVGYDTGHADGYDAGHADGYDAGYEVGNAEGYAKSREDLFKDGEAFDVAKNPIEQGSIASASGNNTSTGGSTRLRTKGFIPVLPNQMYRITTNIDRVSVLQYEENQAYIDDSSSGWKGTPAYVQTLPTCAYIRMTLSEKGDPAITVADFEKMNIEKAVFATGELDQTKI